MFAMREKVADFLETHAKVDKVIYPSKQEGYARQRAEKYMPTGFGSLVGFHI